MKTKAAYVLTCSEGDRYLEQAWMSIWSLKHHNPTMQVALVVDDASCALIKSTYRKKMLDLVDELVCIHVPEGFDQRAKSRWLKTSLRTHIKGDFLFIDTDTVVCGDLSEVDKQTCTIGAVLDENSYKPLSEDIAKLQKLQWLARQCNVEVDFCRLSYYNSGVLYVKDNAEAHKFYEEWHNTWQNNYEKGVYQDQIPLYCAALRSGIHLTELPSTFNCQIAENGLNALSEARIIHYYNESPNYRIGQRATTDKIREAGELPESVRSMLLQPRSQFVPDARVLAGPYLTLVETDIQRLAIKHPRFARWLNRIARLWLRVEGMFGL